MLALARCQTPSGPIVAVWDGQTACLLPGVSDPLPLLRAAHGQPEYLATCLNHDHPGWRSRPTTDFRLALPLDVREVWAAGITYERSRVARMGESHTPDIYDRVYTAERPEIFFKDNGRRTVGPEESIGVRGDSRWSVPEPELAAVLDSDGTILAYTLSDDITARDVEAANPLYLPQAKIFTDGCSVGPVLVPAADINPYDLEIACRIERGPAVAWEATISTRRLKRTVAELADCLRRYNTIPAGTLLLTGTGLVPPDDISLQDGDVVAVSVPEIGVLRNRARILT